MLQHVPDPEGHAELLRISETQSGVFTRAQALEAGMTRHEVDHLIDSGWWVRVFEGVYRIAGAPTTREQRLHGALLWAGEGSCLSHRSSAAIWGFEGFGFRVELTAPVGLKPPKQIVLHRKVLPPEDTTVVHGLAITSVERTLLDLCSLKGREAEIAFDKALRKKLTSVDSVDRFIGLRAERGVRGIRYLRLIAQARREEKGAVESGLERLTLNAIKRHGLPMPVAQHPITDGWGMTFYADLAYPDRKVAIECDGYEYHSGAVEWDRDLRRRNILSLTSWRVLHVTHKRLKEDARGFISELRRALET